MATTRRAYGLLTEVWRSCRSGALVVGRDTPDELRVELARGGLVRAYEASPLIAALRRHDPQLALGPARGHGDRRALFQVILVLAAQLDLAPMPRDAMVVPSNKAAARLADLPTRLRDIAQGPRLADALLRDGRASRAELTLLRDLGLISLSKPQIETSTQAAAS